MFRTSLADTPAQPRSRPNGASRRHHRRRHRRGLATSPSRPPTPPSAYESKPEDQPHSVNVGDVSERAEQPGPGDPGRRRPVELDHGAVAIAAITSCTNTCNPYVMVGAGLLAKAAVEKGLAAKPWVKTSLAPGSKVVIDYYDKAGLTPYLDKLGFQTVGYGCTTCIGNSGPLPAEVSAAVKEGDLAVVSVLSGNRNFEGRINPDVKMNYLASPPLVVAYALAGTMDFDPTTEPLGTGSDGEPVFLADIWPSAEEVADTVAPTRHRRHVRLAPTTTSSTATTAGRRSRPRPATRSPGTPSPPTSAGPRTSTGCPRAAAAHRHHRRPGARPARRLGHHRPHLPGRLHQGRLPRRPLPRRARRRPEGLQQLRQPPRQPRGHDPRDLRQHPAAQPAGPRHRGRGHRPARDGPTARSRRIYEARRPTRPTARRWSSWPARSTARAPRATGRPRAPRCSASGPSSPSPTSASTAPT